MENIPGIRVGGKKLYTFWSFIGILFSKFWFLMPSFLLSLFRYGLPSYNQTLPNKLMSLEKRKATEELMLRGAEQNI